jgi:enoyl-CoA hydratase/carnithine racemase
MPETAIGFSPDVGGTSLLARTPGRLGDYLAATAGRMNAADTLYAGFADYFVPSSARAELTEALETSGDPAVIARFAASPQPSTLAGRQGEIDRLFDTDDPASLPARLVGTPFAEETARKIAANSPLAVACALKLVAAARADPSLEACLTREYRVSHRVVGNPNSDFFEGVRALLIDKDKQPKWGARRLSDVSPAAVAEMLAPLGRLDWSVGAPV